MVELGAQVSKNQQDWLPTGRGLPTGAWGSHLWLGEERGGAGGREDDSGGCGCGKPAEVGVRPARGMH